MPTLVPSRRPQPVARPMVGPWRAMRRAGSAGVVAWALGGPACTPRHPGTAQPLALSVQAGADTSRMEHLAIRPPRPARAWIQRVIPSAPGMLAPPLPEAGPDSVPAGPARPPALEVEPGLLPPVLREAAPLILPAGAAASRFAAVELDVRVSETGEVTDVIASGGGADSALVAAASTCVRRMRFYPARRAGEPIAVWCRQRFEFGPGGVVRP